jgi:hypothetical protein
MTASVLWAWCGRPFTPRTTGGRAQRYCALRCRRAYDAAGRRFVAAAIADGTLTPAALKKAYAATRALMLDAVSPAPISEPRKPASVAPAEGQDETAVLLDELLAALLKLPPDEWAWLVYYRLPGKLVERLRDRVETENRPRFPSRRR